MKRLSITLGIAVGLIALALLAFNSLSRNEQEGDTPSTEAIVTPVTGGGSEEGENSGENGGEAAVDDGDIDSGSGSSALSLLPVMETNQGGGNVAGIGGGGGRESAVAPAVGEMAMVIAPDFSQIFVDATFTLNATLPVEPATADVLQHTYESIDLAEARRIADRFGFTGPLYTEVLDFGPRVMMAEGAPSESSSETGSIPVDQPPVDEVQYELPTVYHAFDGKRQLSIFEDTAIYANRAIQATYEELVPDALTIAESFLQEKGLLDFPYHLEKGFGGGEVLVHRLVNGVILDDPEIYVQVAGSGEIVFASDRASTGMLETLGNYPLISAESAWQLILQDVVGNNISFNIMPDFESMQQPLPRLDFEAPQYWQREYQPGTEAHMYSGPMIYQLAEGEGPPRVELSDLVLSGSDQDLDAIAEQISQMLHIWGQIADDKSTLNLIGWEVLENPPYFSAEGHIQRTSDLVLFLSSSGETYILPDAPADLPDGMKVNLFAWASRDAGLAYPVLDWQNIDEWFDYASEAVAVPMPEPGIAADDFSDPYQFSAITINEVKLVSMRVFDFEGFDKRSSPPEYIQPAWEFTGVTDNGDTVVLRVQAVAPEFLRAADN